MAGSLGAWFIPSFGWQSLFVFGGIAPIIIALLVAAFLPDSLEFFVMKGKDKLQIRNIVAKIAPALARDEQVEFYPSQKKLPGVPVKNLFTEKRAVMTILFWIVLIAVLLFHLHTRCVGAHIASQEPAPQSSSTASPMPPSISAPLSRPILIGRLMDWRSPYVILPIAFTVGFASLVVFGWFAGGGFLAAALLSVASDFPSSAARPAR